MEQEEHAVVKKTPWLGIIAIVYGVLLLLLVRVYALASRLVGSDERVLMHVTIAVLAAILLSHYSLFKLLRKPQQYKWKFVVYVGIFISYAVLVKCAVGAVIKPVMYERQLKSEVAGATKIVVVPVAFEIFGESSELNGFEENDRKTIQALVENIKIAPFEYDVGHCGCGGNQKIEFYQGEKLLAKLSFHHGEHFRWLEGWSSDMVLKNKSAAYFKEWLSKNGVDNFD